MIWRLLRLSGNDATLPGASGIRLSDILFGHYTVRDRRAARATLRDVQGRKQCPDSTVVLMVVALFYKLVLVVIGPMSRWSGWDI